MTKRVFVGNTADFPQDKMQTVDADGTSIVIVPSTGGFCAVKNQCSHLPLPLAGGKVENGLITCPWHNSQFEACTGQNLDWVPGVGGIKMPDWTRGLLAMGKQPQNLTVYRTLEEDGKLFIEMP